MHIGFKTQCRFSHSRIRKLPCLQLYLCIYFLLKFRIIHDLKILLTETRMQLPWGATWWSNLNISASLYGKSTKWWDVVCLDAAQTAALWESQSLLIISDQYTACLMVDVTASKAPQRWFYPDLYDAATYETVNFEATLNVSCAQVHHCSCFKLSPYIKF